MPFSMFRTAGFMFVQIDNLTPQAKESLLSTILERSDPLQILEELESIALERGYKNVHDFINDIKGE